mmetsp:Transcript_28519/g.45889  ORF Transcript_28519/g.45889 Transcript_28519/m.45889 type:complete len:236 (-) Transcript_28519:177-884(-)
MFSSSLATNSALHLASISAFILSAILTSFEFFSSAGASAFGVSPAKASFLAIWACDAASSAFFKDFSNSFVRSLHFASSSSRFTFCFSTSLSCFLAASAFFVSSVTLSEDFLESSALASCLERRLVNSSLSFFNASLSLFQLRSFSLQASKSFWTSEAHSSACCSSSCISAAFAFQSTPSSSSSSADRARHFKASDTCLLRTASSANMSRTWSAVCESSIIPVSLPACLASQIFS